MDLNPRILAPECYKAPVVSHSKVVSHETFIRTSFGLTEIFTKRNIVMVVIVIFVVDVMMVVLAETTSHKYYRLQNLEFRRVIRDYGPRRNGEDGQE